jgi:hypothetical protein
MKRFIALLMLPAALFAAKPVVNVTDADIEAGDTVTWTSDNIYTLDRFVFVEEGAVLKIEAGTVVKGKPGQEANASALIIARGGKIYAEGTKTDPILFTSASDAVETSTEAPQLPKNTRGLWGGVILLGKATINTTAGEGQIEGIPSTNPKGAYGGDDDEDNSGVMRFVSIRFGGTNIGEANEINGLTMGAVGNKTTIEFIEVMNNADDGFEWFGGTVNCAYLVSAFNGDDAFDYDEGWRGRGQYWFAIQRDDGNGEGDRAGEHDGGTDPEDGTPYAIPVISNVTYIGKGIDGGNNTFKIRDNAGGKYYNSVFYDWGKGIDIEDQDGTAEDSRKRLEAGDIVFSHNIWYNIGSDNDIYGATQWISSVLEPLSNKTIDPELAMIDRNQDEKLDPRPQAGSPALDAANATTVDADIDASEWIQPTNYCGAFSQYDLWIRDWTSIFAMGYVAPRAGGIVEVTDADIEAGDTVTWTDENTYLLKGFVFVEEGAVLNINQGTVIKGAPGQGANASALIIARGGKINAVGTPQEPIIFTAEADDLSGTLPLSVRGLWGGVILLGKAKINTTAGEGQIEGIPVTNPKGAYGGSKDDDNSGTMQYVSIRHGGTNIGEANEINGLTMGAVGSKTTIEYIEVYNNADDGFEWFGGTVNCKYLIAAFNGDDAFDYDEGWRGKGQFWFCIQRDDGNGEGDRAGEHDGGTDPEDGTPYAIPTIYNVTYIGKGTDGGNNIFKIRDNAGGMYHNSIFGWFGKGIDIEDQDGTTEDSRKRLEEGDLVFKNNLFWKIGADDDLSGGEAWIQTMLDDNTNEVENPELVSIGREDDGNLDPRPEVGGNAYMDLAEYPADDSFFDEVTYKGAFGDVNWAAYWTKLSTGGFFTDSANSVLFDASQAHARGLGISLRRNGAAIAVRYNIPAATTLRMSVYTVAGKRIATLVDAPVTAGRHAVSWDVKSIAGGRYFLRIEAGDNRVTVPLFVMK